MFLNLQSSILELYNMHFTSKRALNCKQIILDFKGRVEVDTKQPQIGAL